MDEAASNEERTRWGMSCLAFAVATRTAWCCRSLSWARRRGDEIIDSVTAVASLDLQSRTVLTETRSGGCLDEIPAHAFFRELGRGIPDAAQEFDAGLRNTLRCGPKGLPTTRRTRVSVAGYRSLGPESHRTWVRELRHENKLFSACELGDPIGDFSPANGNPHGVRRMTAQKGNPQKN